MSSNLLFWRILIAFRIRLLQTPPPRLAQRRGGHAPTRSMNAAGGAREGRVACWFHPRLLGSRHRHRNIRAIVRAGLRQTPRVLAECASCATDRIQNERKTLQQQWRLLFALGVVCRWRLACCSPLCFSQQMPCSPSPTAHHSERRRHATNISYPTLAVTASATPWLVVTMNAAPRRLRRPAFSKCRRRRPSLRLPPRRPRLAWLAW